MECGSGMFGSGPGPMSKDHLGVYWGGGRLFQMFVGFFVGGGMRLARQYVELFMLFLKLQGLTVGFFRHGYYERGCWWDSYSLFFSPLVSGVCLVV